MGFSSRLKAHKHLLTLETLRFINYFLVGGNARRAALESGLDDADLRKLDAKIRQIDRLMNECREILNLDAD